MAKMIQIRNVPDELHAELSARATARGITVPKLVLQMAESEIRRPDIEALLARVRSRPVDDSGFDSAAYIRRERDSR